MSCCWCSSVALPSPTPFPPPFPTSPPKTLATTTTNSAISRRRALALAAALSFSSPPFLPFPSSAAAEFSQIPGSGGVKALDLRIGVGAAPTDGDQVAIHYYGRLAAKQGWRFDSTYNHKDEMGDPVPFVFVIGSGRVIRGIEAAVKSMKVGGSRRVIIPPSQGYQNTSQEPVPPNIWSVQDWEPDRRHRRTSRANLACTKQNILLVCSLIGRDCSPLYLTRLVLPMA